MNEKQKILLVEDNHDTLDLLELFLYKDYDLTISTNGFEAIKIAEEKQVELILTDIMMPIMDGIKFFNELQKKQATRGIPVIALTSFNEEITTKSLKNMGFKEVIVKPPVYRFVLKTVQNYLSPPRKPAVMGLFIKT